MRGALRWPRPECAEHGYGLSIENLTHAQFGPRIDSGGRPTAHYVATGAKRRTAALISQEGILRILRDFLPVLPVGTLGYILPCRLTPIVTVNSKAYVNLPNTSRLESTPGAVNVPGGYSRIGAEVGAIQPLTKCARGDE